ncbi:MAG: EAL domain-containing protein [Burkholderiales bacterium]|nr:EAL domain-containing protein [Burkholderiales bacterium]
MTLELQPLANPVLWLGLSGLAAALSALLALTWIELVPRGQPLAAFARLAGSGAGLATGLWCVHATLSILHAPSANRHYDVRLEAAFWLGCALFATAALQRLDSQRRRLGLAAAAALGAAACLLHLALAGAQSSPHAGWQQYRLSSGAVVGTAVIACAFVLMRSACRDHHATWAVRRWTTVIAWVGMLLFGFAVASSALPAPEAVTTAPRPVAITAFGALATTAFLALLTTLMRLQLRTTWAKLHLVRRRGEDAAIDPLTRLANRHRFESLLAEEAAAADRSGGSFALLIVGLDGCKVINRSYGYLQGDAAIRELAQRLRARLRPHTLARLAGDQFLVLLPGPADAAAAAALAADLLAAVRRPFDVDGRDLPLTASIGIALYPEHGGAGTLIAHAEAAMSLAKGAGGASHAFFDAHLIDQGRMRSELLRELRVALAEGQLGLFYQPKIDATSGSVTGVEALVRWHHPVRGLISPGVFVPLAERYGLIDEMGRWIIDEVCRQIRSWRADGLNMRVSVNLSARQLRHPELVRWITAALERHRVEPEMLTCEITESLAMEEAAVTLQALDRLDRIGIPLSIDDFGTGHSSLSYLRQLPARELKIDRSFVMDLESSEEARKVASAVINLAKALELKVVAEGVETPGQNEILRRLGCDELQGFLFARPMSARSLARWAAACAGPGLPEAAPLPFQATQGL